MGRSPSDIRANLSSNKAESATGTELGKKRNLLTKKSTLYSFLGVRGIGDGCWVWVGV